MRVLFVALLLGAGAARADAWGVQATADAGLYCGPDIGARMGCALWGLRGVYESRDEGRSATTVTLGVNSNFTHTKVTLGTENLRTIGQLFDVGYFSALAGLDVTSPNASALLVGGPHFGVNAGPVGVFVQAGLAVEIGVTPGFSLRYGFALTAGVGGRFPVAW